MSGISNQNQSRTFDQQLELRASEQDTGAGTYLSDIVDLGSDADSDTVRGSPSAEAGDGLWPRVRGDVALTVSQAGEGAGIGYTVRLVGSQSPAMASTNFLLATYEIGDSALLGGTASKYQGNHLFPFENGSVMLGAAAVLGRRQGEWTWLRYVRIEIEAVGAGASMTWAAHLSNLTS